MTDLYFCGTFRTDWSRQFNFELEKRFTSKGLSCFLPQRDSDQSGDKKLTFEEDVAGIDGADCVVAIGAVMQSANWGFEVGYCYGKKKPVVALTDKENPLDLMTDGAIEHILVVENIDEIDSYFDDLFSIVAQNLPRAAEVSG